MPPNTSNGNGAGYLAAVSASTPNHMVFAAKSYSGPNPPYYTTNGVSATAGNLVWTASTITIPSGYETYEADQFNENICGLTCDTVTGDKFYLDMFDDGGSGNDILFVSTDGGKTFTVPTGESIPWAGGASIHASPGIANDLWALTGGGGSITGGNLYHSTNGGVTWALFPSMGNFGHLLNYSLGANAPGSTNPTLYVIGQYNGNYGVYRSNNMGVSFDTISNDANIGVVSGDRGFQSPWCMAADRHVYGRVYIGGEGTGVSYLQPTGLGTGNGSIVFTSAATSSGAAGSAFSYAITTTGLPITSYSSTVLPGGLILNTSTGVISGSPTVTGTFLVTLTATNSIGPVNFVLTLTLSPSAADTPTMPTWMLLLLTGLLVWVALPHKTRRANWFREDS